MSDMFTLDETTPPPAPNGPKRPKPKPTRKRRKPIAKAVVKRMVRPVRVGRPRKAEAKASGISPEVLKVVDRLLALDAADRSIAMEIAKALGK